MTSRFALAIASAALASAMLALPAQAASGVKVGVLTCSEAPAWGYIIGSSQRLNCRFEQDYGPATFYTGHLSKLGLDIGRIDGGTLTWAVFAPA